MAPLRAEERDVVILEPCSSQNTPGMELSHEKCVFYAPVFLSALRPGTLLFLLLLWGKEMEDMCSCLIPVHTANTSRTSSYKALLRARF